MTKYSPYALGATLYMPATRGDIVDVIFRKKLPTLRSLVICLEDAVSDCDIATALDNLQRLLGHIRDRGGRLSHGPLLFVRPRNTTMAARLNDWPLIEHIDGFVVPKLSLHNLPLWQQAITNPSLAWMPTLETADVFNPTAMVELGQALSVDLSQRIVALRIGGNDLMSCMGLRRNPATTLYDTPMRYVISMLAGVMSSQGFALTAPVFEQLSTPKVLATELALDIDHGMVGKTAIHPSQIDQIHHAYRVSSEDLETAHLMLNHTSPAVFRFNDAMCEPATHHRWATNIIERARWYGVIPTLATPSIAQSSAQSAARVETEEDLV